MKNFQFSIFNFQKIGIVLLLVLFGLFVTKVTYADAATDNALNYLKSKQDAVTGQITGGAFSDASPWAAIAFGAHGVAINTVKNPTVSLADYLVTNKPATTSAAFEWEKWILAIVAGGFNPYDFGGVDFVTTLKSAPYYNANQLGDTSGVNDDWFGVLALIAGKVDASDPALADGVAFIIANQNSDGGWGYAPGVDSDSNDSAAAIQALVAAKEYGVTNASLDNAIANAKTYLLDMQDVSGGFLYDNMPWTTAPDANSTAWALMALNVLGMKDASEGVTARSWLLGQQSGSDGGFLACQYNPPDFICELVSNATITADTLVALSGKGWLVKVFDPATASSAAALTVTPTVAPTPSTGSGPTATPTPTSSPASNAPTPTPTVTPTPRPEADQPLAETTTLASLLGSPLAQNEEDNEEEEFIAQITKIPEGKVLAATDEQKDTPSSSKAKGIFIASIFVGLGISFIFIYLAKPFIIRKFR